MNNLENPEAPALYENLARALQQIGAGLQAMGQALGGYRSAGAGNGVRSSNAGLGVVPWQPQTTVLQAVNEFLRAKARAGRSDRYLQALRVSLKSFANLQGGRPLNAITLSDVERWLNTGQWAPRTQKGYLSDLRVLYNFCQRRGLAAQNPAAAVELPCLPERPPAIQTVAQVRTVLEFARRYDLNLVRALAVRYFTGLRSAEVGRLEEREILLSERLIEVTAAKSKTRRRRLVAIEPNLEAWLALGGKLPLHDINNRMRWFTAALREKQGIDWAHNVTRHCFVSYHLAHFKSAARTALEAGHTEQMTFAHYRALVTPAAAAAYWQITPMSGQGESPKSSP